LIRSNSVLIFFNKKLKMKDLKSGIENSITLMLFIN